MFKLQSLLAPALAVTVVACGARFSAHENDGAPSGGAGEASGGFTSSGGSLGVSSGGEPQGGSSSSGGNSSVGSGGTVTGTGGVGTGSAGRGNWGNAGWWSGNAGASSISQCATLREEYQATIEKARACDKDSTDQCSTSSVAPAVGGCGCPVLINTKSAAADAAKKAYQAYSAAKCDRTGPVCDIACPGFSTAYCQPSATGAYVCTGDGLQR